MRLQGWFPARGCRAAMAGMLALLAAGCSDKDDGGPAGGGGPAAMAVVGGVAAVGAPIVGGTITARCGGGQTFSATSTATGSYSIQLPSSALPCALQVTGGQVDGAPNALTFHSFASAAGTTNLTPITDLAVAIASGMTPSAWFNAISANAPPQLRNLANAAARLLERLEDAGYTVPNNLNPFTTPFTATLANAYDQLLESLGAALRAAAMSYDQLLVQVVEEGAEFEPPPPEEEPGPAPSDTVPGTVNAALAGTYTLTFDEHAEGSPFNEGQQVTVVIGANSTLQIDGKTLSNPFFRRLGGPTQPPHLPELIWRDDAKKLEYALTDNQSGVFNEINVADVLQAQARFLGQLREPEEEIPSQLTALGGNYSPLVFRKNTQFSSYVVGNAVPITIDGTSGVIDVDGGKFRFDPADANYIFFSDLGNNPEPSYQVRSKAADGDGLQLNLFIENGELVAFRLNREEETSFGGVQVSTLYMELRPLPAAIITFFQDTVARAPLTLRVVQADTNLNNLVVMCDTLDFTAFLNGSGDAQTFTYFLHKATGGNFVDQAVYGRLDSRYSEQGNDRTMAFARSRLVLRGGFVDVLGPNRGDVRYRITNDPALISANCPSAG